MSARSIGLDDERDGVDTCICREGDGGANRQRGLITVPAVKHLSIKEGYLYGISRRSYGIDQRGERVAWHITPRDTQRMAVKIWSGG